MQECAVLDTAYRERSYCRYLGEWYDASEGHASFKSQQSAAVKNCWIVAGIYGGLAILSVLGNCYYSVKAKRS